MRISETRTSFQDGPPGFKIWTDGATTIRARKSAPDLAALAARRSQREEWPMEDVGSEGPAMDWEPRGVGSDALFTMMTAAEKQHAGGSMQKQRRDAEEERWAEVRPMLRERLFTFNGRQKKQESSLSIVREFAFDHVRALRTDKIASLCDCLDDPVAKKEKEGELEKLFKFHKSKKDCGGDGCATCLAAVDHLNWPSGHSFLMPSRFTTTKGVLSLLNHYRLVPSGKVAQALAALGEVNAVAAPAPPPLSVTPTDDRAATNDDEDDAGGLGGAAGASVAAGDATQVSGEASQGMRSDATRRVTWGVMREISERAAQRSAPSETAATAAAEQDAARMVERGEAQRAAALNMFTPSMATLAMEEVPAPAAGAGGAAGRSGGGAAAGTAAGSGERLRPGRPTKAEMEARQAERQQESEQREDEELRQSKRGRTIVNNSRYKD